MYNVYIRNNRNHRNHHVYASLSFTYIHVHTYLFQVDLIKSCVFKFFYKMYVSNDLNFESFYIVYLAYKEKIFNMSYNILFLVE